MIVGVPREIKPGELRVALTPAGAHALAERSHPVLVERGAGAGSGIRDEEFAAVGAVLTGVDEVWARGELVLKVKEPLLPEVAPAPAGPDALHVLPPGPAPGADAGPAGDGRHRDRLRDRSARGRKSPASDAHERGGGSSRRSGGRSLSRRGPRGRGILLSGVPGVPRGNVVILGAGTVGVNAARTAVGLGS